MGMSPSTLVVARIKTPEYAEEAIGENEYGYRSIIIDDNEYDVTVGNYEGIYELQDNQFAITEIILGGWGDSCTVEHALDTINLFKARVEKYCAEHKYTYDIFLCGDFS